MTYYKAIATIINFIPIMCPNYQELKFISQMNEFFNFDHNVFLVDSSADIDCFISRKNDHHFTPQSLYSVEVNPSGLEDGIEIKSKNTFLIAVVPESANFESSLKLLTQIKKIQRIHYNIKIGIFLPQTASPDDLHKLFQWFWKNNIVNIHAAIYSSHTRLLTTFAFNPFGTFQVINVSRNESLNKLFLDQKTNFQQYPIRVGLLQSYESLSSDDKLWRIVLRSLNASFAVVEGPWSNIKTVYRSELFVNDTVDIVISFIFAENVPGVKDHRINMCPMQLKDLVIVVPEALPYSEFSAYLRTVTSDIFFGYALITIAVVMICLTLCRYIKQKKCSFIRSVVDVLNILMNDNQRINYSQLSRTEVFLLVPLTFIGFVVVNCALSALKSFLTRPIIQPQINTVEEIYRSPFPIFTKSEPVIKFLTDDLKQFSNHDDWQDRVRAVHPDLFYRHIETYDTSNAFFVSREYAKKLINNQKRLNVRGYHISKLHIMTVVSSYPVNDNFPFVERLNEIHHRVRSAGLHEKWWREDEIDLWRNISRKYNSFEDRDDSSENTKMFAVPMFIVYGWVAGTIVLIIEIVWKNFKFSRIFNNCF